MRFTAAEIAIIFTLLIVLASTQLLGQAYPIVIYLAIPATSLGVTVLVTGRMIPRMARIGMVGEDENKANRPKIPEMGGIAIIAGFSAAALIAIPLQLMLPAFSLVLLLASIITIHILGFIGIGDDLLDLPQWFKAVLPLIAAIPLVVVNAAGSTAVFIPFIGSIDFGVIFVVVLIPLAVAVCSNLTNMLAGFNGMEAGMGIVIFATLSLLAFNHGLGEMLVLSLAMLGGLLGFFIFNRYPARIFPGDVGTLVIGCVLASSVIIGNLESAGVILMFPYVIDFFIKAANRFPHTRQEIRGGKLHPEGGKVKGLVHLVMRLSGGISERGLVLFFIGLESAFALIVLALYYRF